MAEELNGGPQTTDPGQAPSGDPAPQQDTSSAAPKGDAGQPSGTTDAGPQDTFFDPKELPPELQTAYKNMQAAFTKRMQELSGHRKKIDAYDAFMADPVRQIQQVAQAYGLKLTAAEARDVAKDAQAAPEQPQTWDDVYKTAEQRAIERIRKELEPFLNEVRTIKKNSIESQLTEIDPTWQQYEGQMTEMLKTHPTLARDPAALYRMSVPPEVLESRAVQKALAKMDAKAKAAKVSGASQTTKKPASGLPDRPVSFQEAVEAAKKSLEEQGLRPPK